MTARPEQMKPGSPERPLRLLIAEDNPVDAELEIEALKRAGYPLSFDIVDSKEEFQRRLEQTNYDIILSDHNLRTWTGMDALEILQQSAKDIPFVVITATLGDEAAVEYIKRGAADYVLKGGLERLPSAINRALTDKVLREEAARLQEQILYAKREWEFTFDGISDAVVVLDETGSVERANRAAVEALGWKEFSDLIGKPFSEIIYGPKPDPPEYMHILLRQTGIEERQEIEVHRLGKIFDATCTPVREANGAIRRNVLVLRDITERKRALVVLRESEERYHSLFENMLNGFAYCRMLYGEDGQPNDFVYLAVNQAFKSLTGLKDVVGKRVSEAVPGITISDRGLISSYGRVARTGVPERFEIYVEAMKMWFAISVYCPRQDYFVALFDVITERKRAEETLREIQERLELAVRASNTGLWDWDILTNKVHFSREWKSQLGYQEHEIGDDYTEWGSRIHPDDLNATVSLLREYLAKPQGEYEAEYRLRHKDGSYRWMVVRGATLQDPDGKPYRMLGSHVDITDRKRAEKQLRENEESFRLLFANNPLPMWVWDEETLQFLEVNEAAIQHYGYSRDEFLGMRTTDIRPAEDLIRFLGYISQSRQPVRVHGEWKHRLKDGRIIEVETISHELEFSGRNGNLVVVRDITRQKSAERALRESEGKYRRIVETANEGIWMLDQDGKTIFANSQTARMLGCTEEEMSRLTLYDFTYDSDLPEARSRVENRRMGGTEQYDVRYRRKDGSELSVLVNAASVFDETGRYLGTLGMLTDITERKSLEEQYRAAQKMEAVGRLAGGIAHDFNNMLNIILGYCQLLREDLQPQDRAIRMMDQIQNAGDRAAALTRQLLAFSRQQVLQPKVLDLNAVVAETEKMFLRLIGEDIEVVLELDPALGGVKADQGQLEQVIMNLVINARDAMPRGGKLVLSTANTEFDESFAQMRPLVPPGAYVRLIVSDTGEGMNQEVQSHIFEPFFTTKEKGKGTGLGLATVYGIVKQSGGFIWVYSEPGKGTIFNIYLPRVNGAAERVVLPPAKAASAVGHETILIVEDEESLRDLTYEFLSGNGYRLLKAEDSSKALEIAGKHQDPIHLLLTDVVMPGLSGLELSERLAPLHPGMKTLFVSGYTDTKINHHDVLKPGVAFLEKPFSKNDLTRKVRELLDELFVTEATK